MRALASIAMAAIVAGVGMVACDEPQDHVYEASLFDIDRACVHASRGIGYLEAPADGDICEPVCLVEKPGSSSAARAVYVSDCCGPYPPAFDTSGDDPACAAALEALAGAVACDAPPEEADGGGKGSGVDDPAEGDAGERDDAGESDAGEGEDAGDGGSPESDASVD